MTHTSTHTVAVVSKAGLPFVESALVTIKRKQSTAKAFYLESGHYEVETISATVQVEAPIWIIIDAQGYPYPCDPDVFEATWRITREAKHHGRIANLNPGEEIVSINSKDSFVERVRHLLRFHG